MRSLRCFIFLRFNIVFFPSSTRRKALKILTMCRRHLCLEKSLLVLCLRHIYFETRWNLIPVLNCGASVNLARVLPDSISVMSLTVLFMSGKRAVLWRQHLIRVFVCSLNEPRRKHVSIRYWRSTAAANNTSDDVRVKSRTAHKTPFRNLKVRLFNT